MQHRFVRVAAGWALALVVLSCGARPTNADRPIVVTSVLPQAWLVRELAGDLVRVEVLIPPGASPATFEPSVAQMRNLAASALCFRVGHPDFPFERAWLDPMLEDHRDLRIVSQAEGVPRLDEDPHVWVSPGPARSAAAHLAEALQEILPEHRERIADRLETLTGKIDALDHEIAGLLAPHKGRRFLVFHPAWGYLAERYGLVQVAVEHEGKEPSPAELTSLARRMRADGVDVLFVQPQVSPRAAEAVARELDMRMVVADPLAPDWDENLRRVARALDEAFRHDGGGGTDPTRRSGGDGATGNRAGTDAGEPDPG